MEFAEEDREEDPELRDVLPAWDPAENEAETDEEETDGEDEVGWRLELLVQVCTCQRPF